MGTIAIEIHLKITDDFGVPTHTLQHPGAFLIIARFAGEEADSLVEVRPSVLEIARVPANLPAIVENAKRTALPFLSSRAARKKIQPVYSKPKLQYKNKNKTKTSFEGVGAGLNRVRPQILPVDCRSDHPCPNHEVLISRWGWANLST